MKHRMTISLFAITILIAGSCNKSADNTPVSPREQVTNLPHEITLSLNWSQLASGVYVSDFPALFEHMNLEGKDILVYATANYGGYQLEAIINQRSAPFYKGKLWADVQLPGLKIFYQTADITQAHFENLEIKVVIK